MSRLIVKGLPKRYDEKLLKELFTSAGDVTDVRVLRTSDGRSRQFGFVGFRSDTEARQATRLLNNTFVDSCRVVVEEAQPVGSGAIPRPWSKYSKGSSRNQEKLELRTKSPSVGRGTPNVPEPSDERSDSKPKSKSREEQTPEPAFAEFKAVVAKRSKKALWSDGDEIVRNSKSAAAICTKSKVQSRKAGGTGLLLEKSHVVFQDDDSEDDDEFYEEVPDANTQGNVADSSEAAAHISAKTGEVDNDADNGDSDMTDAEFLRSKIRADLDDSDDDASSSADSSTPSDAAVLEKANESDPQTLAEQKTPTDQRLVESSRDDPPDAGAPTLNAAPADSSAALPEDSTGETDASESGRLFVRNLAYSVTEDHLEQLFERYGGLSEVHIVQDPKTRESRGVAFVLFLIPENAVRAMSALDGTIFFGRLLHIMPAKARPNHRSRAQPPGLFSIGGNRFKDDRENARKEAARSGSDTAAYNATHMSSDAVADVMSSRYGIAKSEFYNTTTGDSGSAAVRLASAEAQLQSENRDFLLQNGIDMVKAAEASRNVRRKELSRRAFFVKNLPARTDVEEVRELFSKFGRLERLVLVPSGVLAVIVFLSVNDAKKAYSGTAYTRFKDRPIYLEWISESALCKTDAPNNVASAEIAKRPRSSDEVHFQETESTAEVVGRDGKDSVTPRLSVFVKNLNFSTTEKDLRKHFEKALRRQPRVASSVRAARVATKRNPRDPNGPRLSAGFGFVEFSSESAAATAVKCAQGLALDGHALQLKLSVQESQSKERNKHTTTRAGPREACAKLIVRNIAFEATAKDLRQLFSNYGQIKTVRIPRRQDGAHRGFGFVEFVSKNEAASAMSSLSSAHLYGRHLVIEYASTTTGMSSSLQDLQKRAEKRVAKRRKLGDGVFAAATASDVAQDDEHERMVDSLFV